MKKAIVIGATGMVGAQLVKQLISNNQYNEIVSFVRRPSTILHPKLIEQVIDFDKLDNYQSLLVGDVLFSTLGTTLAQAKSKDAQYHVDFTYQYNAALMAAKNGVPTYVLISSAGANARSSAFYMSMKGKLEDAVKSLPFKQISIIRPGQLDGNRTQKRLAEKIGLVLMNALNSVGLLKKYQPIQAWQVAQAMINAAEKKQSATYTLQEVFTLANKI